MSGKEGRMKNRKHHVNRVERDPVNTFADPSSEEKMEAVIGPKVLYNWLYQQEEEDYYLSLKDSCSLPDYPEAEALFVDF
jgi:hypothetical protein